MQKVAYRYLYARLLTAMSMQEAKAVLGFPPTANPSPQEISKAWRTKAFENHPDRGGDPKKMVEINVAKDILEGKGRATWRPDPSPRPEPRRNTPPPTVETIPGASFEKAVSGSGAPANVEWKCISKPVYAQNRDKRAWNSDIWTLIGTTDQKVYVLSVKRRSENLYFDPDKQGNVRLEEDWSANLVSISRTNLRAEKTLPSLVRSPSVLFEDGTVADPPTRWVVWEGGRLTEAGVRKVKSGSGAVTLKNILATVGLISPKAGQKTVVEMIPHYSLERGRRVRQEQGGRLYTHQSFDYEVRVNGKSESLSDDTIKNLDKNGFVMAVFGSNPADNKPYQLHRLRGAKFFGANAAVAIRLLADSLTSEPSWLQIALEGAAEEYEDEAKTAAEAVLDRFRGE